MRCFGGVSAGCSPPNFCNLVCAVLLAQQMSWRHKSVSLQRHHYNPSMQQHRDSQMAQKLCREIATINGKDEIFCRKLEFMRLLSTTLLHHQLVFWQCFFFQQQYFSVDCRALHMPKVLSVKGYDAAWTSQVAHAVTIHP